MSRKNKQLKLVVKNGAIYSIYDDELVPLMDQADGVDTRRASRVEPDPGVGGWMVEMPMPMGGQLWRGFRTRKEALDAEVRYLDQHLADQCEFWMETL